MTWPLDPPAGTGEECDDFSDVVPALRAPHRRGTVDVVDERLVLAERRRTCDGSGMARTVV